MARRRRTGAVAGRSHARGEDRASSYDAGTIAYPSLDREDLLEDELCLGTPARDYPLAAVTALFGFVAHHLPTANASPVACGRRTNRSAKTRFSSESVAVGSDRLNHGAGPGRSSPQPVRLYDSPASGNCYKARLLLALLDQPYERVPVDIFAGDTLTPEFGRLNPARETPILELDGGEVIVQSNAVLWYLGEGSEYLPGGPSTGPGWSNGCTSSRSRSSEVLVLPDSSC